MWQTSVKEAQTSEKKNKNATPVKKRHKMWHTSEKKVTRSDKLVKNCHKFVKNYKKL